MVQILLASLKREREPNSTTSHLLLQERSLTILLETMEMHLLHLRLLFHQRSQHKSITSHLLHSQLHSLEFSETEVTVHRSRHSTITLTNEIQPVM